MRLGACARTCGDAEEGHRGRRHRGIEGGWDARGGVVCGVGEESARSADLLGRQGLSCAAVNVVPVVAGSQVQEWPRRVS